MQAKVIKKKMKVPIGMKDNDMAEMFNQMLGAGAVNMSVAYPRYKTVKGLIDKLIDLFHIFNTSDFMVKRKDLETVRHELAEFIDASQIESKDLFRADFSDYEWNLELVEDEQKKQFSEIYKSMREAKIIRTFTVVCDRAIKFKKHIQAFNAWVEKESSAMRTGKIPTELWKFITTMPGTEFFPFPFIKLNYKDLFARDDVSDRERRFLMTVFCKSYEFTYKMYHEVTSPDINVDEFVDVIMANIDRLGGIPELSRCKDAMTKIKESVSLLKTNFNNYYRDFVSTKQPTIMMEHFILDVSHKTKANPKVMHQFKQIIAYYRKAAEQHIHNPKIKMLFDKVNASFSELEENTENLSKARDAKAKRREDGSDSDDDISDDEPEPETEEQIALREKKDAENASLKAAQEVNLEKSVDELVNDIMGVGKKGKGKNGKK